MCSKSNMENYSSFLSKHGKIQILLVLSKSFIHGEGRNSSFVGELEGLFSEVVELYEDDKYEDLARAFAMYGAATSDYDNAMMSKELKKVIPTLEALIT